MNERILATAKRIQAKRPNTPDAVAVALAKVQLGLAKNPRRALVKDQARQARAFDAPDERRKVAGCPKCPAWFASVEDRNAHKAQEHGPVSAEQFKRIVQDANAEFVARARAAGEGAVRQAIAEMLYGDKVLGTVGAAQNAADLAVDEVEDFASVSAKLDAVEMGR